MGFDTFALLKASFTPKYFTCFICGNSSFYYSFDTNFQSSVTGKGRSSLWKYCAFTKACNSELRFTWRELDCTAAARQLDLNSRDKKLTWFHACNTLNACQGQTGGWDEGLGDVQALALLPYKVLSYIYLLAPRVPVL